MECKAKGCKRTQGVKVYASFCGIKIAYCKKHNYLFRDIKILNKMANGKSEQIKQANERRKKARIKQNKKKWEKIAII